VEDIHEALVTTVPAMKFGLAFCEASGKCLVRYLRIQPIFSLWAVGEIGCTGRL
jgi:hypothetical protein